MAKTKYNYDDGQGMGWRMEGSRPVIALADKVMAEVTKPKRGGARTGSGRKKGATPTDVLHFRVPKKDSAKLKKLLTLILSKQPQALTRVHAAVHSIRYIMHDNQSIKNGK